MRSDQLKAKRSVIRWTDEEWDRLAELVHAMRKNSPDSIATLANRAQQQFPEDRRRPGVLTTAALRPLIERIQKMDRELQARAEKSDEYAAKLGFFEGAASTREELLTSLGDEEICQHFRPRLLQMLAPVDVLAAFSTEQLVGSMATGDLAAVVARRFVEHLERPVQVTVQLPEQRSHPAAASPAVQCPKPDGKQKRIAVIGIKGDEERHIRQKVGHLCELTFMEVEKLRTETVPRSADKVIIWAKFVSHKHRTMVMSVVEPHKVFEHFFGIKELVRKIENLCRGELGGAR